MLLLGAQGIKLCVLLHFFLIAVKSKNLTVYQTPSEIRILKGETAQINCSYKYTDAEQLRIAWKRNTSAQMLCQLTENKANFTAFRDCTERVNITLDLSTNSSSLVIYDLHLNDSDIYFCKVSIEIPPPTQTAKGKGTHLTVEAPPTIQLTAETLPFPNEGIQLVCTSVGFYPSCIRVSWFKGQLIINETDDGTLYSNSDGSFSFTSFLNLSVSDWNEGANYSCQVNHSTLPTPITKWISVRNQGPAGDKLLWIISMATGLIVVFVVVAVLCTCSILKVLSSRKTATSESERNVRAPVREQSNNDNEVIYSLLGQSHHSNVV
ncbi:tapasin-related protein-like [Heptranchias perlo]|uniref:tapasin-related protein-like n=1 Tax=Heptranchias perlo TaxID=212740 RepID=UPI00355A4A97